MKPEKPQRYVIFGAGAIGGAVGALLARAGSRVACVARPAVAEALNSGILIRRGGEEFRVKVDAAPSLEALAPEERDVLIVATKSQHTREAIDEIGRFYGPPAAVACFQNGVRNEVVAALRFHNVYAGLMLLSAVLVEPGVITVPRRGSIAVGRYPSGTDVTAERMAAALSDAGFEALASRHVMAMKYGKLVANLNNATLAITDQWLEQALSDVETRRLMVEVREEGLRVLEAAGVQVEPPPDEPSPIRILESTESLRQPPEGEDGFKLPEEKRTYISMWQDLRVGRGSNEAEYLNGEIVRLGEKLGIPTPYNSTLLKTVSRMFEEGIGPGLYSPGELRALILNRKGEPR